MVAGLLLCFLNTPQKLRGSDHVPLVKKNIEVKESLGKPKPTKTKTPSHCHLNEYRKGTEPLTSRKNTSDKFTFAVYPEFPVVCLHYNCFTFDRITDKSYLITTLIYPYHIFW